MSQFNNLPGINVNIADGGLILPEDASTESLLIIAPSTEVNAPKEPVLVRESNDLTTYGFGGFTDVRGNVNPIAAAWKAAFEGGNRQTYLMALEGSTTTEKFANLQDALFGILADFAVDNVVAVGVYADEEATVTASDLINTEDQENFPNVPGVVRYGYVVEATDVISAPVTVELGSNDTVSVGTATITLTPGEYNSAEELVAEINSELSVAIEGAIAVIESGKLVIVSPTAFTTGASTLAAVNLPSGKVAVKKRHINGTIYAGNFAKVLADFAETQTLNFNASVAFIGTKAPAGNSLTQVKAHVDRLVGLENDYSGYVQVVAAPELGYQIPNLASLYYTNGVVTYAALVSTLRAESAPTNKMVMGVSSVHYNLSLRQLNNLTGKKFVTFRVKNGSVVVTDGCTTAPDLVVGGQKRASDFARLSTLRITTAASQLVREICEPFIGEPNRMPQYNALNAAIKGGLEAMKQQGAINDYRFSVVARGVTLNEAVVTLEIIPAFELRKIAINVSLRPSFLA
jgi:hypothetical protein